MESVSSGPAWVLDPSDHRQPLLPTRASPGPNEHSERQNRICGSGRSMSIRPTMSGPMPSCACWPDMWSGTCARHWLHSCSRMMIARRSGARRWLLPGSPSRAKRKAETKTTSEGLPARSFETLMDDLATLTLNSVSLPGHPGAVVPMLPEPTDIQERAKALLGIRPERTVPSAAAG